MSECGRRSVARALGALRALCAVSATVLLAACNEQAPAAKPGAAGSASAPVFAAVIATNRPLAEFASEIGSDAVQVQMPVPPDVDPPFWKPTAEDIVRMQKADLILANGAAYERWMKSVTLPKSKIVDTSAAFKEQLIEVPGEVTHSHGPGGAHSHKGTAFTTWIDFNQAAQQANAVCVTLIERAPALAGNAAATAAARDRAAAIGAKLQGLAARTAAVGKALNGAPVWGSHPIYQYLARQAGLNMQSVHWEPDEAPSAEQLKEFDVQRQQFPAAVMLWEDEPLPATAALLKERGICCVVFAPCAGKADASSDEGGTRKSWLDEMEANVRRLEELVAAPAPAPATNP